jgi:hypothetical protein
MKAQTFIFVHDQQIVLDYIEAGKFDQLPDVQYVFLGQRPVDLLDQFVGEKKVIVARNLPDNIEHYPNLVAWTGWYAIARNGLITAEVVNLFEYDVNIIEEWEQPYESVNYFPYHATDSTWWNYNGIQDALKKYIIDPQFYAQGVPMTSNYTLKSFVLVAFINGFDKFFKDQMHPQAGHIIERYCGYVMIGRVRGDLTKLTHLYADSHGTQGRGDRYQDIKYKLL